MNKLKKRLLAIALIACIVGVMMPTAFAVGLSAPSWYSWGDLATYYTGIYSINFEYEPNEAVKSSGVYFKSANNSYILTGADDNTAGAGTVWPEELVERFIDSYSEWKGEYEISLFVTSDTEWMMGNGELDDSDSIAVTKTGYKLQLDERNMPIISDNAVMQCTWEHGDFGAYTERLTVDFDGTFEPGWYLGRLSYPNNTNEDYKLGGYSFWLLANEQGKLTKYTGASVYENYGENVDGIPSGAPKLELKKVDTTLSEDNSTMSIAISPVVTFTGTANPNAPNTTSEGTKPSDPDQSAEGSSSSYIYNGQDLGENIDFSGMLDNVTDETSAVDAMDKALTEVTDEQKQSVTGIDKLTLLAEEAAARANTVSVDSGVINVTSEDIPATADSALTATTGVLSDAGVNMQRNPRAIVNYDAGSSESVSVTTESLPETVDKVRVTTDYALATVDAQQASSFTMSNRGNQTIEVNFDTDYETVVTVSFPGMSANDTYKAVVDAEGKPVGGKYNPATGTLEAKLTESGVYRVVNNEADFSDIKTKSQEMQDAIKELASKGIINGTTETTYAPDDTISRAEVTALLMRTLSLLNPNANGGFADVTSANWYCGAAGSAKEHNIINGFEDNTFRGDAVIAKDQIVAVSSRTLREQMDYKAPSDVNGELSVYSDAGSIENWAREDVALATMTNLVLKRTDGKFDGSAGMTRGDAAIIIKRLFDKLW